MSQHEIRIETIVSAPFSENSYIASVAGRDDCIVVDPGLEPQKIVERLVQAGLTPLAILNTHGHSDHIAGNARFKQLWPECPLLIGRGDAPKLADPWQNLSAQFGLELVSPPADRLLDEGETLQFAGISLLVRDIPGHSSGHIVFIVDALEPPVVFGGDVLFAGSIGRTDFPDGSFEQLAEGIWAKLFILPDATRVFPGHGPMTTIGEEKRSNPFVGAPAGYRAAD